MLELTQQNFDSEVLKSPQPVLVDFYAPWCGPCKMISPLVEELAKEYAGKMKMVKVNVDEAGDLAGQFGVMSIPTLIFFKGGQEQERLTGLQSKKVLVEKANSLL